MSEKRRRIAKGRSAAEARRKEWRKEFVPDIRG